MGLTKTGGVARKASLNHRLLICQASGLGKRHADIQNLAHDRQRDAGEDAQDGGEFLAGVGFSEKEDATGKGYQRAAAAEAHHEGN